MRRTWGFVMLDNAEAVEYIRAEAGPALQELEEVEAIANYLWDHYLLPIDDEYRERIRVALAPTEETP